MAITYHAGRRIQGLDSDRTATQFPAGSVGGWVELGRTTLGSAGDTLTVSSLPDKRYYMYLHDVIPDTYVAPRLRLGNSTVDTGSNYSRRSNENGGTDGTSTSADHITGSVEGSGNYQFVMGYIANLSGKEKLNMSHSVHRKNAGAVNAPGRGEIVGKWTNTSNPLDIIQMYNGDPASGDYAAGSELVVLGWDESDTHTNNFWEELASVDLTGGANANLSSGTITAKKYLWVQYHTEISSGSADVKFTFNNDTGSNYADRRSINGLSDGTKINQDNWEDEGGLNAGETLFVNMFIINNASNEKLGIVHSIRALGGAGAGNAPQRREWVAKWANTSNQITEIDLTASSSTLKNNSYMRVWGAD